MNTRICIITWSLLLWGTTSLYSQNFLKADGVRIIDGKGNEVILRGMGLGGWMLQEGYMLQIHGIGMQHTIRARIASNNTPGKLQVIINGNLPSASASASESESESESTSAPVPITGGYQQWQTISLGKVNLSAGTQTIRLMAERGGFNLNFLELR